ncbi:hypothetical protein O1611_g1343 [Lasiodiplodia mahajangana]|uniref:Uncharacterized protein n=1 Tax=Lasiodiplodia mahajangana TaxID=1108764 RepID=A0ACC2JYC5_9PEZI|nr:hypothetical protein O1611_g1343 [Lasiodiplodia mahajangana]
MIRLKIPVAPVKAKSRRDSDSLSSLDLSDDSGYSGVEDITGSDDDEEDVEAAEEEHILSDERQHASRSSPRPKQEEEDDDDDEEALGDDEGGDYEGDDDDAEESASWDGLPSEPEQPEIDDLAELQIPTVQRRVRFDVPDSDDDEDTETDEETAYGFFPDLFIDKSKLDPTFRLEVDHNSDDDSDAYWDHYGTSHTVGTVYEEESSDFEALMDVVEDEDTTPIATPMTQNDVSTALSTPVASPEKDEVSLDGYQSDGDTTDEEEPVPRPIRRKTRRDLTEESDTSDVEIIKGRRGHPRVGRFSLDKSFKKPIAMVNPRTGKLMIFTARRSLKRGLDLSPEQFKFPLFDQTQASPILGNPGNIMMSGMISSNTFGDFMNTHTIGPAEAWYAQIPDSNGFGDTSGSEGQAVDEEEKNLRIEDFLEIDDDSNSSDDQQEIDKDEGDEILCTPGRPTTSSSDITSLLDHFEHNSNLVGAFRRDQAHHRLITRSKATHDSLAFSGPYFEGTLRGIKDGRIATANVPISPLRRRKKAPEFASSPLSSSTKRKAPSDHRAGHKKQRSLPDVGPLHL